MVAPIVVPRSQHTLSRRDIDPDALRVLYRLHHANFLAYLVGGSVRDLLLGRRPKDFDVGTDAHPYQVKRLFRNCWIVGRRFRLAHVKFGTKVIEVATFRRQVPAGSEAEPPLGHGARDSLVAGPAPDTMAEGAASGPAPLPHGEGPPVPMPRRTARGEVHHENTFGTPEEDAFRRDFTVNALFYDIATFSIIDYTGGLADLQRRLIRSIGPPEVRFLEDPVRMLRAIVLSARLGFSIDPPIDAAIRIHAPAIAASAPARLLEEYYKILRSGASRQAFEALGETGLLRHISPEIPDRLPERLAAALDRLDRYRRRFADSPETLTNPVLLGCLLVPLGLMPKRAPRDDDGEPHLRALPRLGELPLARKDIERLAHVLTLQPRLADVGSSHRRQVGVARRPAFRDALTWLEIHGDAPDLVEYWRGVAEEAARPMRRRALMLAGVGAAGPGPAAESTGSAPPPGRRRRRRRRRRDPAR